MKQIFTLLAIVALSLTSQEMFASELAQKPAGDQAALQAQFGEMSMSASEFAALTPKEIAKKAGKKMSWGEKILFKIAQKRIKKQLVKEGLEGEAGGSSKKGKISLFLAGFGLLLMIFSGASFTAFVVGLICGVIALVFGIIGLKKDENKALAIIGTVLSTVIMGLGIWFLVEFINNYD
jgi:hypothetical protein